jgi:hypothetical protein
MLLNKLQRNQEHEADVQGMMLMARAGYHPDFVFRLHHLLQMKTGDRSKFAAFFSDHPRWATRDQRSNRAYLDALGEFNRLWPDSFQSPGGAPPVVAFLENPLAFKNKRSKRVDLSVRLHCRNAESPLTVMVAFTKNNRPVPSHSQVYRDSAGNLLVREEISCPDADEEARPLLINLPATALAASDRRLKGRVVLVDSNGEAIAISQSFDVHFPKP